MNAEMPTDADLMLIGAAVLNSVTATLRLGHSTPGMTLDYMTWVDALEGSDSAAPAIVRDFVTWTSGRNHLNPGAKDRLERFVTESGWSDCAVANVARLANSA